MRFAFPWFTVFAVGCSMIPVIDQEKQDYDRARMGAMTLCSAARSLLSKSGEALQNLDDLVPLLDRGEKDLLDPWGQKYQFEYKEVEPNRFRLVVFTTEPNTGKRLGWPRELAEKK